MSDLFAPPDAVWQRPSRRYLALKLILIPTVWTALFASATVPAFLFGPPWLGWALVYCWGAWVAWRMVRAPFEFRRRGYAERDTDVYVTRGLMTRRLVCVPYGRMQLVEVESGPLARVFRLASVRMITSSTSGSVTIEGLDSQDAAALRDRLIERGEAQQAGI